MRASHARRIKQIIKYARDCRIPGSPAQNIARILASLGTTRISGRQANTVQRKRFGIVAIESQSVVAKKRRQRNKPWKNRRIRVWDRADHKCELCGIELSLDEMTADHIIPFCISGDNDIDNLQCLCQPCNVRKDKRLPRTRLARHEGLVALRATLSA